MANSASQGQETSLSTDASVDQQTPDDTVVSQDTDASQDVATRFLGQWNRLVSTTNWEKGRIICSWREALIESGAAVTDYSDEAWAQLVGNVTSQHVGRLRRVTQRFGDVSGQYEDLFWSHFQAALDWDDAEMWLEGAIQNNWSVSQMRGRRWETLETSPEEQRSEVASDISEIDEESLTEDSSDTASKENSVAKDKDTISPSTTSIKSSDTEPDAAASETMREKKAAQASKRTRLKVDVENLPDDLAEAFESFKLAIIAHRREGWSAITPEAVVECLEGLRELALATEE